MNLTRRGLLMAYGILIEEISVISPQNFSSLNPCSNGILIEGQQKQSSSI